MQGRGKGGGEGSERAGKGGYGDEGGERGKSGKIKDGGEEIEGEEGEKGGGGRGGEEKRGIQGSGGGEGGRRGERGERGKGGGGGGIANGGGGKEEGRCRERDKGKVEIGGGGQRKRGGGGRGGGGAGEGEGGGGGRRRKGGGGGGRRKGGGGDGRRGGERRGGERGGGGRGGGGRGSGTGGGGDDGSAKREIAGVIAVPKASRTGAKRGREMGENGAGGQGSGGERTQGAGKKTLPGADMERTVAALEDGAMGQRNPPSPASTQKRKTSAQDENQFWNEITTTLTRSSETAKTHLARNGCGRQENKGIATIPSLLLYSMAVMGLLACVSAVPVPVSLHVEGRGHTLQGENYSLVCVVTPPPASDPTPVYDWYRNGQTLENQSGQVLTFSKLFKSNESKYQCRLSSGSTERVQFSEPFTLHVVVLENISLVPEVEVEEGQTVILNCSVHSDPTATLTWRVDGKTVRSVRSNSDSLVLHNASRLHLAVVECEAYNIGLPLGFLDAYSLIRKKGTYEIIPRPWLGPRGVPVLHRPFGMECLVMKIPNFGVNVHLTYTWYKDNTEIEGQSDMILEFPSLTREHTGLYTCTARNGKPFTTSLESNKLEVVVLMPPVVHIEPQKPDNVIKHPAGGNLTLTCNVTQALPGVATDGYKWSYLPSPGGQLRPLVGKESTLTLVPLTRQDSGQYFCQAWNYEDFGGLLPPGNASVTVDVMYVESIKLTSALQVNEGDRVTLTCSVDSNSAMRLSWIVEGQEVRHVTANTDHYVLERAACSDSKTYTCRASNSALPGLERIASTEVSVNCTQNGHREMHASDTFIIKGDPDAVKGQPHSLQCLCGGSPGLNMEHTYCWVKDSKVMKNKTTPHLTLSIVTENDTGIYQCGSELASALLLSDPFKLHVIDLDRTRGFLEIGVSIIVIAVIAVATLVTVTLLIRRKRRDVVCEGGPGVGQQECDPEETVAMTSSA